MATQTFAPRLTVHRELLFSLIEFRSCAVYPGACAVMVHDMRSIACARAARLCGSVRSRTQRRSRCSRIASARHCTPEPNSNASNQLLVYMCINATSKTFRPSHALRPITGAAIVPINNQRRLRRAKAASRVSRLAQACTRSVAAVASGAGDSSPGVAVASFVAGAARAGTAFIISSVNDAGREQR